jgi:hypothetical protein
LPVAEPEGRPRPRVRRGSEAAVEGAGAATGAGGRVMKMVEPVEMPLPSHPHILPRRDMGAPQTSNHDVCTRGDRLNGFAIWFSPMGITYPN